MLSVYPIVKLLAEGIITNTAWEVVKAIVLSSWRKIKSKNSQSNIKQITFGLKMKFKDNKLTDFKLNNDFSEETTLKAMEMIFTFMNHQQSGSTDVRYPDFCIFDEEKNTWNKVDVMEEFRKMAQRQRKSK